MVVRNFQRAKTLSPLDRMPLYAFGLRQERRGRRVSVLDADSNTLASIDIEEPGADLATLCVALLQQGRRIGRQEAFTAVRERLDDGGAGC